MSTQHYFPQVEADRINWLDRYAANLVKYGPLLGLVTEEINASLADISYYGWLLRSWNPAIQQHALAATAFKSFIAIGSGVTYASVPTLATFTEPPAARPPGVVSRLFNQVQRLKLHSAYTDGMGQDLGIISTVKSVDHPLPLFTAVLEQGPKGSRVRMDYTKYGHDGVAIESRINSGLWLALDHYTKKTIYDDRPITAPGMPESRDYRMRWWDKDQANGEWSVIQTVLVGS